MKSGKKKQISRTLRNWAPALTLGLVVLIAAFPAFSDSSFSDSAGMVQASSGVGQSGNQVFYTLSSALQISGPELDVGNNNGPQYISDLFHIIVSVGDQLAQPYLTDNNDPEAYWAFLVAALVVPFHEANYQQFRALSKLGSLCEPINTGIELKDSSSQIDRMAYQVLNQYLENGSTPVLADCSTVDTSAPATQLLGSADWLSIGMMQMNIAYHVTDFVEPQKYLSIEQTVDSGLNFYKTAPNGFDAIYRKAHDYSCLQEGAQSGQPLNYSNLIRAAWAVYNAGSDSVNICRFTTGDENDAGFLADLNLVLSTDSNSLNLLGHDLQGQDLAAYQEIISNFKNGTNVRTNLDLILSQTQASPQPSPSDSPDPSSIPSDIPSPLPTPSASPSAPGVSTANLRSVNVGDGLNVRTSPSLRGRLCGVLPKNAQVQLLDNDGTWSKILLPSGSSLLATCGTTTYVVSAALSPVVTAAQTETGVVTGVTYLNVRRDIPEGAVVSVLRENSTVQIISQKRESPNSPYLWYQVAPSNGWVYGEYIRMSGEASQ